MADTPTTEAGKRMLNEASYGGEIFQPEDEWVAAIVAIEDEAHGQGVLSENIASLSSKRKWQAEAVTADRARIRREVEALPPCSPFPSDAPFLTRVAVLAILDQP